MLAFRPTLVSVSTFAFPAPIANAAPMNAPSPISHETDRQHATLEHRLRQTTDLLHVALAVLLTRGGITHDDVRGFRLLFANSYRYGGERGAEHTRWIDGMLDERAA